MIIWEDCTPKGAGGSKTPKYDVKVTIVKQTRKNADERLNRDVCFTFRNEGLKAVRDYRFGIISKIMPNTERIYFQLLPNTPIAQKSGRTLTEQEDKLSKRLSIPFKNVTQYDIVENYWLGDYRLEWDDSEGYYYISPEGRM